MVNNVSSFVYEKNIKIQFFLRIFTVFRLRKVRFPEVRVRQGRVRLTGKRFF